MRSDNIRPALRAAILYIGGIYLGSLADPPLWLFLGIASLLWSLALLVPRSRFLPASFSSIFLSLALLLAACLQHEGRTRLFPRHHLIHGRRVARSVNIQGKVISDPLLQGSDGVLLFRAACIDSGWGDVAATGKILLRIRDFDGHIGRGDDLRVVGRIRVPRRARNPGEFDYHDYLRRRSVHATLTARTDRVSVVARGSPGWWRWVVERVRRHLEETISRTLQGPPQALLRGLLLGQREDVPEEVTAAFSDTGVIHVLAVSGLHVGLIVGIFYSLLGAVRLPDPFSTLVTLALVVLYMFVVDLRPSVVRATIMAGVVMVGRLLERDTDLLNVIPFAGLLILVWNPQFLFELGFQLSFTATLAIVYLHDRLRELCFPFLKATSPRWLRWMASGLSVSLAAQLGTWPIIAYHFQRVPWISLLANLLVVPLVGCAVALGFTSLLLIPVSCSLARIYAAANWLVLNTLIHLVKLAASLPFSCLAVPRLSPHWMASFYLFALLGANLKRSRAAGRAFLFGGLIALNLLIWHQALVSDATLKVLFFDVGQGDSALVCFPNGRTMLVDGGERKMGWDCGEQILCPYFRRAGIDGLDVVVLTHADNDHVGGLPAVLEKMPVRLVLDSGARHLSSTYLRFLSLAVRPDLSYHLVRAGDVLHIDDRVRVQVLHPTDQFVAQNGQAPLGLNNGSVVLRLQYGSVSFLLTGDIEEQAERAMLQDGRIQPCAVLKVPHHGSISSSSLPFLEALQPRLAVISVGQENTFGHPHDDVLQRYRRLNVIVCRTDQHGAVTVETNGTTFWLKTTQDQVEKRFSMPPADVPLTLSSAWPVISAQVPKALFP